MYSKNANESLLWILRYLLAWNIMLEPEIVDGITRFRAHYKVIKSISKMHNVIILPNKRYNRLYSVLKNVFDMLSHGMSTNDISWIIEWTKLSGSVWEMWIFLHSTKLITKLCVIWNTIDMIEDDAGGQNSVWRWWHPF